MFALAVLLLIAAAALVLWVLFGLNGENNNDVHFHGFGIDANLTPLTVFLLGALTLLLVWAATRLIAAGTKRKYRQHKETKELKKEHQLSEKQRLEAERERERLAAERDKEHDLRETAEARLQGEETGLDLATGRRHEGLEPRLVAGLLELLGGGGIGAAEGLLLPRGGAATEVEGDGQQEDDGGEDEGDGPRDAGDGEHLAAPVAVEDVVHPGEQRHDEEPAHGEDAEDELRVEEAPLGGDAFSRGRAQLCSSSASAKAEKISV